VGSAIKRLVLDVLKPHTPILAEMATELSKVPGVEGVNLSILEIDKDTENVKITLEGHDINYEEVLKKIKHMGGTVHSTDEVAAGKRLVEEVKTHQDK